MESKRIFGQKMLSQKNVGAKNIVSTKLLSLKFKNYFFIQKNVWPKIFCYRIFLPKQILMHNLPFWYPGTIIWTREPSWTFMAPKMAPEMDHARLVLRESYSKLMNFFRYTSGQRTNLKLQPDRTSGSWGIIILICCWPWLGLRQTFRVRK